MPCSRWAAFSYSRFELKPIPQLMLTYRNAKWLYRYFEPLDCSESNTHETFTSEIALKVTPNQDSVTFTSEIERKVTRVKLSHPETLSK